MQPTLRLVVAVDSSSWTMWTVREQSPTSCSVEEMILGTITVVLLRMLVSTALVSGERGRGGMAKVTITNHCGQNTI